jgi:N-acetylglutamate synthase-like GNAT family acetyltransferase
LCQADNSEKGDPVSASPLQSDFREKLQQFLKNRTVRNTWIHGDEYEIYVRKSKRFGGKFIDIGNVSVHQQGRGFFTRMLSEIECQARWGGYDGIYVEQILTPRFCEFFKKLGWTRHELSSSDEEWFEGAQSYYKKFFITIEERSDEVDPIHR